MATINGGNGNDVIAASEGDNVISGGNGNDVIFGGEDDVISGGNGDDVIEGGGDSGDSAIVFTGSTLTAFELGDVLTGGRSNDLYRFNGGADDHDLITDFRPGNDRLELFLTEPERIQQVVITGGVHGPGLLIITDVGPDQGDNTDGLFLRGVTAPLVLGSDFFFS